MTTDTPDVPVPVPPVVESLPHLLQLYVDGETIGYDIECPYPSDDPTRPCRMFSDYFESNTPQHLEDGCGVRDHLENGGYEAVSIPIQIDADSVKVSVSWDEYPVLRPWD